MNEALRITAWLLANAAIAVASIAMFVVVIALLFF